MPQNDKMDYFGSISSNRQTYIFCPTPYPKIVPLPLRDIYQRYEQIQR